MSRSQKNLVLFLWLLNILVICLFLLSGCGETLTKELYQKCEQLCKVNRELKEIFVNMPNYYECRCSNEAIFKHK